MKNNKGVTLVSLVVTIIVLVILAGVSINLVLGDNGIITKAKESKENLELAKIEEEKELNELYTQLVSESSNLPYDSIAKLAEFKIAIAKAIDEAGGVKPDASAETSVFANNIKGIIKEVTKDATATADNISEGKTAWVNGRLITGTGIDVTNAYNSGHEAGVEDKNIDLSNNYYFSYSINDSDMNNWKTMHTVTQDGSCLVTINFISKNTTNNRCDFVNCKVVDASREFNNYFIFN